jgi:allophanate hydrolase
MAALRHRYATGELTPTGLIEDLWPRLAELGDPHAVWISRLERAELLRYAQALAERRPDSLPLYGVPFAIKDNIDLAGASTTAACPAFAYEPKRSATVVQRLIDAGAIPLGKTNLDQFATGLVGTRSPYGACRNSFDPEYISGGSSAGSAVAVALGLATFSLGTDTAGSGRVPAAFNNIVGHKPTCGLLPTTGVVPACRSLDVVSVFAQTAEEAAQVLACAAGYDPADAFSRPASSFGFDFGAAGAPRVGAPKRSNLEFFGNREYERLYFEALATLESLGAELVEIDLQPFLDAARLLYEGPWVAERYAGIRAFFDAHEDALHPVTRAIVGKSKEWLAADAYEAGYRLRALKRASDEQLRSVDCVATPTAGSIYRIAELEAEPIRLNSNLGYYTNFMNLLDYAAVSVPAGFTGAGLPCGLTLFARAHADVPLLNLAAKLQRASVTTVGARGLAVPPPIAVRGSGAVSGQVRVAVCGAHMSGLPLNHELTSRGARRISATSTAPLYGLYALAGGPPRRPGLVRRATGGAPIEVEVWELAETELGGFVAGVPAPLSIGRVTLADGTMVAGFLCEAYATAEALDITSYGGWRRYVAQAR